MQILLCLLLCILPAAASSDIDKLRGYLGQRDQVARLYMPQQATQGEVLEVLVMAPGASSVTVSGSRKDDADAVKLVSSKLDASGRANLSLNVPLKPMPPEEPKSKGLFSKHEKKDKTEKPIAKKAEPDVYYLEALVTYPSGEERKALVFASNASYIGFNGVQIMPVVKDNSGAANMARSFIPGMAGLAVGSY